MGGRARFSKPIRDRRGFSLFGVSVAVFALALATAFVVPRWQERTREAAVRATLADLKTYADAFLAYAHDHADWPDAARLDAFPPGMESALAGTHWRAASPIGGRYAWLTNTLQRGERFRAAVGIVSTSAQPVTTDPRQLERLRQEAASAGLDPNRLRLGYRNQPVYVLEH